MDKKNMEEYRSKKEEILELRYKLEHLGEGDSLIGNDVIMDYKKGFPRPQSVVGYDYVREQKLKEMYQRRINKLEAECLEVERWIEDIPDSLTRRIFRLCFADGLTYHQTAKKVHMDKSTVCRRIDTFLKVATNATDAMV